MQAARSLPVASSWVTLGPLSAIPEGEGRTFDVGGTRLAVFRARNGAVYATQADCPHKSGPLADGLLGTGTLICPLHSLKFDLATGQAHSGDCHLRVYPAKLSGNGHVLVEL
ncbi:MAG: Rieske (2Fe-2S) protein [Myxococcales bacterium]|nr:MAG: Rieske (2Fe-2S) protein [Myxococcales bacterium]